MEKPTQRYQDVARLFREHARLQDPETIFEPATSEELSAAEEALGCRFPASYGWFQREFGYFPNGPLDIYSVRGAEPPSVNIVGINVEVRDGYLPLPPHLILFSDSGGSDFYCFDTSALERGECPIVWWDHEGSEVRPPELVAPSFLDWIEAELRERAAEAKESLLDSVGYVHLDWIRNWLKNK